MEKFKNIVEKAKEVNTKEEFESSIRILEEEIEKSSNIEGFQKLLIDLLFAYGLNLSDDYNPDYKKAIQIFNRIIDLDPKNYRAYYNLGIAYFELKEKKKSLKMFKKALKIKSEYKFAIYNIGLVYESQNKLKKALKYYEKALLIDEKFSYASIARKEIQQQLDQKKRANI